MTEYTGELSLKSSDTHNFECGVLSSIRRPKTQITARTLLLKEILVFNQGKYLQKNFFKTIHNTSVSLGHWEWDVKKKLHRLTSILRNLKSMKSLNVIYFRDGKKSKTELLFRLRHLVFLPALSYEITFPGSLNMKVANISPSLRLISSLQTLRLYILNCSCKDETKLQEIFSSLKYLPYLRTSK